MKMQKSRQRVSVSVGDSVRIMRELQELSQNQLAELTGIPQSTISAIERDRVNLGVERAKILARTALPSGGARLPVVGYRPGECRVTLPCDSRSRAWHVSVRVAVGPQSAH